MTNDTKAAGNEGSLYFFMPRQALREQNFAACAFEIQFTLKAQERTACAMSESEDGADNLTGVWNGMYRQTQVGSVPFTATLIQSGDHIGGSTHEPCIRRECPRKTHLAILSGHRSGYSVSFTKSYDPPGFGFGTVSYAGELNADATEIAGMWSIDNVFFGAFVMSRAGRRAEVKADAKLTTAE